MKKIKIKIFRGSMNLDSNVKDIEDEVNAFLQRTDIDVCDIIVNTSIVNQNKLINATTVVYR